MRIYNPKVVGLSVAAVFAIVVNPVAASASTVLADDTFTNVTASSTFTNDSATTVTLSVCSSCGSSGGAALQSYANSSSSTAGGTIAAGGGIIDNLLTYTPSTQGAIVSLSATANRDTTVTNNPNSLSNTFRLVIEQGGVYYVDAVSQGTSFNPPNPSGWLAFSAAALTASSFEEINFTNGSTNSSEHPDFSIAGSEILFGVGFQASNVAGSTSTADYDYLDYTINPTPLPAALPMFMSGLAGLGLISRRRKRKNAASALAAA